MEGGTGASWDEGGSEQVGGEGEVGGSRLACLVRDAGNREKEEHRANGGKGRGAERDWLMNTVNCRMLWVGGDL